MAVNVTLEFDDDSRSAAEMLPHLLAFIGEHPEFKVHTLKIKDYIIFPLTKEAS